MAYSFWWSGPSSLHKTYEGLSQPSVSHISLSRAFAVGEPAVFFWMLNLEGVFSASWTNPDEESTFGFLTDPSLCTTSSAPSLLGEGPISCDVLLRLKPSACTKGKFTKNFALGNKSKGHTHTHTHMKAVQFVQSKNNSKLSLQKVHWRWSSRFPCAYQWQKQYVEMLPNLIKNHKLDF